MFADLIAECRGVVEGDKPKKAKEFLGLGFNFGKDKPKKPKKAKEFLGLGFNFGKKEK